MEQHYHTHRTSLSLWKKLFYIGLGAGAMYWCLHGGTDTLKTYTEKAKQEFARRVVSAYQDMNKQKEEKK